MNKSLIVAILLAFVLCFSPGAGEMGTLFSEAEDFPSGETLFASEEEPFVRVEETDSFLMGELSEKEELFVGENSPEERPEERPEEGPEAGKEEGPEEGLKAGKEEGFEAATTAGFITREDIANSTPEEIEDRILQGELLAEDVDLPDWYFEEVVSASTDTNKEIIWNYFIQKGLSKAGVAGIIGNLEWESSCLPENLENAANIKSGVSDREFTDRVDCGSISREEFIASSTFSVYSGGTYGYGLAQWTYSTRKAGLYDFAKARGSSIGDIYMQLDYMWKEMSTTLKNKMINATDYSSACVDFHNIYEGSADDASRIAKRIEIAKSVYESHSNGQTISQDSSFAGIIQAIANETYNKSAAQLGLPSGSNWCGYYVRYILDRAYSQTGASTSSYLPYDVMTRVTLTANAWKNRTYGEYYSWTSWSYNNDSSSDVTSNLDLCRPKVGDIVLVETSGGEGDGPDHMGMIVEVNGNGTFITAEGNTGAGTTSSRTVKRIEYSYRDGRYRRSASSGVTVHAICAITYPPGYEAPSGVNPIGYLDAASGGNGTVEVGGWAFDWDDVNQSIDVHIYIGGAAGDPNAEGHCVSANLRREDVNNVFPGAGVSHGFSCIINTSKRGEQPVYAYAINVGGGGENTQCDASPKTVFISEPKRGSEMTSGGSKVIPEGDYIIVSAATTDKSSYYYLDIEGVLVPPANGTNVSLCGALTTDPEPYDVWTLSYDNGFYTIRQKGSNAVLDVANGDTLNEMNIQACEYNGSSAQKWAISPNNRSGYRIQAKCSGYSVDIENGRIVNGTNIRQCENNDSEAQSWLFIPYKPSQPISDGRYMILSALSDDVEVDVPGDTGDIADGLGLLIWSTNVQNKYNSFDIIKLENGYYKIQHAASGKCWDVTNGVSTFSQQLALFTENGSIAQQWAIISKGGDLYTFVSRANGLVADVQGGSTANETRIIQYPNGEGANQKWKFVRAEYTVAFQGNGGIGVPPSLIKYYNNALILPGNTPTREGYIFDSWNTKADGTGTAYAAGAAYQMEADVTLFAQWRPITYTISFEANGGENPPPAQTKQHGMDLSLSSTKPVRQGYKFLGWSHGEIIYQPGDIITENEDMVLVALWELLPDLILPASLTRIEEEAFSYNTFAYPVIPASVTEIGPRAFLNCTNLQCIQILADNVVIARDAFSGVSNLTIKCHEDSDADWFARRYGYGVEYITSVQ